jgi:hypothetical protein
MTLSVESLIDQARDGCMHAARKRGQNEIRTRWYDPTHVAISLTLLYLLYESFIFSSMNEFSESLRF